MPSPRFAALAAVLPLALVVPLLASAPASAVSFATTVADSPSSLILADGGSFTRELVVGATGRVGDVQLTVDFLKSDYTCEDTLGEWPFHDETGFSLTSPAGTNVTLVNYGTYGGDTTGRVVITFDDAAASGVSVGAPPVAGTFQPASPLSAFDGEAAAGTWTLTVSDSAAGDPLCYFGASLTVSGAGAPTLPAATLAAATRGAGYAAALPTVAGATSYAIVDEADLPPGVTFDTTTGTFGGTPTVADGAFAFEATATDLDGTSAATAFSIDVQTAPALTGAAAPSARAGVAFSYAPSFSAGFPSASGVTLTGVLPDGVTFDTATGTISGTPGGVLGDFAVELTASNAAGSFTLPVTISVAAGPVAELTVTPSAMTVARGGRLDFVVTAVDSFGNAVDITDEYVLSSSVASDAITGSSVTFPHASPHTITATHTATGVSASTTVEVLSPPAATEAQSPLAATGADAGATQGALLAALLALAVGVGLMMLRRRTA